MPCSGSNIMPCTGNAMRGHVMSFLFLTSIHATTSLWSRSPMQWYQHLPSTPHRHVYGRVQHLRQFYRSRLRCSSEPRCVYIIRRHARPRRDYDPVSVRRRRVDVCDLTSRRHSINDEQRNVIRSQRAVLHARKMSNSQRFVWGDIELRHDAISDALLRCGTPVAPTPLLCKS